MVYVTPSVCQTWPSLTVAYLSVSLSAVGNKTCSSAEKLQDPNFNVQFCESKGKYFLVVPVIKWNNAVIFGKVARHCQKWPVPLYRYRNLSDRVQLVAIQLFRSHRLLLNLNVQLKSSECPPEPSWCLTFVMMALFCGFKIPGDRIM